MRTHYHQIGAPGGLGISEENFIKVNEITKQHEKDLWIAGMADIFMYYRERESSKLSIRSLGDTKVEIGLTCMTDPELYEQPLTMQVALPEGREVRQVRVTGPAGNPIKTRKATVDGKAVLRFEIGPENTTVTVSVGK